VGFSFSLGLLDTLAGTLGPMAALAVLVASWHAGNRGSALLVPGLVAFAWLAFGETATGVSRIILAAARHRAACASLDAWMETGVEQPTIVTAFPGLSTLTLTDVLRLSPDGRRIGEARTWCVAAGRPAAVVGPSGSGKTSLLKQIAGWIGDEKYGRFSSAGVVLLGAQRRALSHLCLHDAAILSDTIRENLFAPDAPDAACWRALTAVELDGRVTAAGGLDALISQEMFSLGEAQRLNLARAILSRAPIVLLDEPVEHLDSEQGVRILKRVLSQLEDRIVIYSTHRTIAPGPEFALSTRNQTMA
jgi:ABC-type transport system involved in cytochrome bd biosynthesis fused ATPase/permease subunit